MSSTSNTPQSPSPLSATTSSCLPPADATTILNETTDISSGKTRQFPRVESSESLSFALADSSSFNSNSFTAVSGVNRSGATDSSLHPLKMTPGVSFTEKEQRVVPNYASSRESSLDSFKAASPQSSPGGAAAFALRHAAVTPVGVAGTVFSTVSAANTTSFDTEASSPSSHPQLGSPLRVMVKSNSQQVSPLQAAYLSSPTLASPSSLSHVQLDMHNGSRSGVDGPLFLHTYNDSGNRPTLPQYSSTATVASLNSTTAREELAESVVLSRTSSLASSHATTSSHGQSMSSSFSSQSHPVVSRARSRSGPLVSKASSTSLDGRSSTRGVTEDKSDKGEAVDHLSAATTTAASHRRNSLSLVPPEFPRSDGRTTNVYINGIDPGTTEASLYALVRQFGNVLSIRTFTRHVSGRASGYGFVLFSTIESAEACIAHLRGFKNIHPSFSKQPHKIPGIQSDKLANQFEERYTTERDAAEEGAEETFRSKMMKLQDNSSCNLYLESLPMSISEAALAALLTPYKIQSTRFFQTRLSVPPRVIAFVRLESRSACEEIIERLHGKVIRGMSDQGARCSVRFADTSEQRELRRSERASGEPSTSGLTIAQAALLNMRGTDLRSPSVSSPSFQHSPNFYNSSPLGPDYSSPLPAASPALYASSHSAQVFESARIFNELRRKGEEQRTRAPSHSPLRETRADFQVARGGKRGGFSRRGRGANNSQYAASPRLPSTAEEPSRQGRSLSENGQNVSTAEGVLYGHAPHQRSATVHSVPQHAYSPVTALNHGHHYGQPYDNYYYSSPETDYSSMSPSLVSPALSYSSSSLRTPAAMSPVTPYLYTIDPYQAYRNPAAYPVK